MGEECIFQILKIYSFKLGNNIILYKIKQKKMEELYILNKNTLVFYNHMKYKVYMDIEIVHNMEDSCIFSFLICYKKKVVNLNFI